MNIFHSSKHIIGPENWFYPAIEKAVITGIFPDLETQFQFVHD